MKSILLHADEESGMEGRLDAALCLAAQFDCLVTCVQVTLFDAYVMGDPFGGYHAFPEVAEELEAGESAHRLRIDDRLKRQRVRHEWSHFDGPVGHVLAECARLADVAIVSLPGGEAPSPPVAAWLALHSRTPVLAVPHEAAAFTCKGDALVAWDGSAEAAYALRSAVPMLRLSPAVHVVTVTGKNGGGRNGGGRSVAGPQEAVHYLLQHGIEAEGHALAAEGKDAGRAIVDAAADHGAHFIVAGAYGHSRLHRLILGDVTSQLLATSRVPLLLAH